MTEDLDAYAEDLRREIVARAHVEGSEQMRDDVLAEMMIDVLIEAGEVENANAAHWSRRGAGAVPASRSAAMDSMTATG